MSSWDVDDLVEEQLGYTAGRAFRRLLRPEEGEALAQAVLDRGARIAEMETTVASLAASLARHQEHERFHLAMLNESEQERDRLLGIIESSVTQPGEHGAVSYGEFDEDETFLPPASLPNIPELEAKVSSLEAENARLHGVLMFLGQGVRRLWAAVVNRQYGARSLVGDVALDMKEHMEEAIPGWSVGSTSGTLEATLSSRSDLLANGERLKRALDLACERGAGWRCPADGMQDCPTVRTAPNCVVCWRAYFEAQANHIVEATQKVDGGSNE